MCPQCGVDQRPLQFHPDEHCGSPDVLHFVCAACQVMLRERWAARLAAYFDELARARRLAA